MYWIAQECKGSVVTITIYGTKKGRLNIYDFKIYLQLSNYMILLNGQLHWSIEQNREA